MAKKNKKTNKQQAKKKGGLSPVKLKRWGKRIGVLVAIVAIGYGAVMAMNAFFPEQPGFSVAVQGRTHSENCSTQSYNTNPPTSGCHRGSGVAPYGVSSSELPLDLQIHNLEHGAVILQYRASGLNALSEDTIAEIESFVQGLRQEDTRYCRVMSAPYPGEFSAPEANAGDVDFDAQRIAVTAWGRMMLLEDFNSDQVLEFINAHINNGPENVNDCNV